jgi:ribosomal protein S28E/S33
MSDELDALMERAAAEGEDIGDDELEIDLSEAVDVSPFAAKGVPVEVVKSLVKTSAAGNKYIKLQLRVFEGEYTKRVIFENVNLKGTGAGFGRQTLDALGAGIDWDAPRVKPQALVGLKGLVDTVVTSQEGYSDKTECKNWRPYASAAAEDAASLK